MLTKSQLTSFYEVFEPGIIGAGLDALTLAEAPNRGVPPKSFQHDAYLLLGGELAAGDMLDIPEGFIVSCILASARQILSIPWVMFLLLL